MQHSREVNIIYQDTDRVIAYALLSRLFHSQVLSSDVPRIEAAVGQMSPEVQVNYENLLKQLQLLKTDEEAEQGVKIEHAHLFLLPEGVKPFESVYRSHEKILQQQPWQDVKAFYGKHGFQLDDGEIHPEDHIAVELSFMAALIETEDQEETERNFFESHLIQWLPELMQDLIKNPYASFYREAAICTQKFIEEEQRRLHKRSH